MLPNSLKQKIPTSYACGPVPYSRNLKTFFTSKNRASALETKLNLLPVEVRRRRIATSTKQRTCRNKVAEDVNKTV